MCRLDRLLGEHTEGICKGLLHQRPLHADKAHEDTDQVRLCLNGTFCFKAPDSVRWAYDAPVKSVLLLHQGTSRRFTQGHSGWTEDAGIGAAATSVMLQEIMLWSTGRFTESQGFTAELLAGTAPRIQLRPRDSSLGKIISGIEIIPAPDRPGMIQSIIIREGEGNTTTLDFSEVKINARA